MRKRNKKHRHGLGLTPESRDLGSYLPAPGAPEPIGNYVATGAAMGDCGCGCGGSGGCGKALSGLGALGDVRTVVIRVGTLAAAYVAFKEARKHKGIGKWALYAISAAAAIDGYTTE